MTPLYPTKKGGGDESSPPLSIEIEKSDVTRIRVARSIYRDREYIDVRTLIQNDAGDFIPTRKGITLSPEMLPTFINALRRIQQEGGE